MIIDHFTIDTLVWTVSLKSSLKICWTVKEERLDMGHLKCIVVTNT